MLLHHIIAKSLNNFVRINYGDIENKMNKTQYGGKKGVGTDHLIVELLDRIRKAQDDSENLAVIINSYVWKGAFDPVWDEYSDIRIYSNIFRQIYSYVQIFVNFFQGEYIRIFIHNLFMLTNIFGYSFVQYL